jgi:urea transporter
MKQDSGSVQAGLSTFNAVLVGCVTVSLWTPIYDEPVTPKLWAFVTVGSALR